MNFSNTIICPNCATAMEGGGARFSPELSSTWRKCICGMNALLFSINDPGKYELEAKLIPLEKENYEEKYLSLFKLSNITVLKHWSLTNQYNGSEPWLLVKTQFGLIKIGWRKRVINIDWSDTEIKYIVEDDVTKDETFAHAYGYEKAITYLTELNRRFHGSI